MNENFFFIASIIVAAFLLIFISVKNYEKINKAEPVKKSEEVKVEPEIQFEEPGKQLPQIAIILDDVGYNLELAEKFFTIDPNITLSILPFSPYSKEIAYKAHKTGFEIMLHLPMDPFSSNVNPGRHALLANMSSKKLEETLYEDIDSVPFISGVNNHMGSKLTSMKKPMKKILEILKERNLFFIDSKTTNKSVCKEIAIETKIPFCERDIFLDNILKKEEIIKQVDKLIDIAEKNGSAIGICHPHSITLEALMEEISIIKEKAEIIKVSSLTKIIE